ncbi:MAG TPA: tetratricopeptide repeat protein [Verrucomicrobiae bacterium]|jgi:hypothetical protein
MRLKIIICILLAAVTVAIYWPAGHFGIVRFDDTYFVIDTPAINGGLTWQGIKWCMTGVAVSNWHPVTSLSFVLTHQFFGRDPQAEHWVNILFHAVNAALLFLFLNRLTRAVWRPAIAAAIFAWHPLRVESVAWISERKDMLCGFFFLLALFCYAKEATGKPIVQRRAILRSLCWPVAHYRLTFIFFLLALMSKPMAVSLPLLLLLLDVWPLKRFSPTNPASGGEATHIQGLLLEKWPFFALAATICAVTFFIQKYTQAMAAWYHMTYGDVFAGVINGYLGYLEKFFWPSHLAVIYPLHRITDMATVWLAGLLLSAITALCVLQLPRRPYLIIGWLWYIIACLPIIGVVHVGAQAMADRYTYLPLIGPTVGLVWLIADWSEKLSADRFFASAIVVLLCALAVVTRQQIGFWHDTVTLFEHTLNVTENNYTAHFSLGTGYQYEQGMTNAAIIQYRIAAKMKPDDVQSRINLGIALLGLGRTTNAISEFEKVLQLDPDNAMALNDLAWTLATDPNPALRDGQRAVQLARHACGVTRFQVTLFIGTLAAAYAEAGQFDDAITTAQRAISVAQENHEPGLMQTNQKLLELYRQHKPYHESVPGT